MTGWLNLRARTRGAQACRGTEGDARSGKVGKKKGRREQSKTNLEVDSVLATLSDEGFSRGRGNRQGDQEVIPKQERGLKKSSPSHERVEINLKTRRDGVGQRTSSFKERMIKLTWFKEGRVTISGLEASAIRTTCSSM